MTCSLGLALLLAVLGFWAVRSVLLLTSPAVDSIPEAPLSDYYVSIRYACGCTASAKGFAGRLMRFSMLSRSCLKHGEPVERSWLMERGEGAA
jgi:hypothetical protein